MAFAISTLTRFDESVARVVSALELLVRRLLTFPVYVPTYARLFAVRSTQLLILAMSVCRPDVLLAARSWLNCLRTPKISMFDWDTPPNVTVSPLIVPLNMVWPEIPASTVVEVSTAT